MRTRFLTFLCAALVLTTGSTAYAANCALRNPDRQIYEMFPQATNYRSLVGKVDSSLKQTIEGKAGTPLTLNDLGKHTLYVVMKKATPIGLVHARSEVGGRGSIELVWALDMNLKRQRLSGATLPRAEYRGHKGRGLPGTSGWQGLARVAGILARWRHSEHRGAGCSWRSLIDFPHSGSFGCENRGHHRSGFPWPAQALGVRGPLQKGSFPGTCLVPL